MSTLPSPSAAPPATGPKQKRSLRSQELILSATERLLTREGCHDFTLLDLSRESGISIGGIYRRFVDKDGLMLVLQERLNQRMLEEYRAFVDAAPEHDSNLATRVSVLTSGMAENLKRHAPVLRKIVEASMSHPVLAQHGIETYHAHLSLFRQGLSQYRAAIRHEDPDHAIEFCFNVTYELIASHFGFGRRGTIHEPDWERLVGDLQRLCINYLIYPA